MRLRPLRWQSRRQRPRIEVCDGDVVDEVPNHAYRGVGVDDLEKAALPQCAVYLKPFSWFEYWA
jgi:hypothetical protein